MRGSKSEGFKLKSFIAGLLGGDVPILQRLHMPDDRVAEGLAEWVNGGEPEFGKAVAALKEASVALHDADRAVMRFQPAAGLLKYWIDGELDALRLCKYCKKKWFAARRTDHEFCCGKCRILFNGRSEAATEASKIRMRAYRERLKAMKKAKMEALQQAEDKRKEEKEIRRRANARL